MSSGPSPENLKVQTGKCNFCKRGSGRNFNRIKQNRRLMLAVLSTQQNGFDKWPGALPGYYVVVYIVHVRLEKPCRAKD